MRSLIIENYVVWRYFIQTLNWYNVIYMGKLTRPIFVTFISFYFAAQYFPGIGFGNKAENLLLLAVTYAILALVVKPIIKVLLLPFNLLTLGAVGALLNLGIFFLLTFIYPFFTVGSFHFPGANIYSFPLPPFSSNSITTASLFSLTTSIGSSLIYYLIS